MSNIEKIRQEIERLRCESGPEHFDFYDLLDHFKNFIDSMQEETSCIYDTNELTPTPSVNIEDVARVQFASHAHVFDRKRKAVFDWKQFKEVAGIFYGFGKRDSLPEEKLPEDLEEATKNLYKTPFGTRAEDFIAGAAWQAKQLLKGSPLPEDTVLFQKGVEEGRRLERDDLALSIDDIEKIHVFLYAVKNNKQGVFTFTRLSDEQYKEVLRRFKEAKK